ncbi:MAG: TolB family protein [Gemmatimonadales bacterium]
MNPPTWFEDGWSHYRLSPDGRRALFGARFGLSVIDLEHGTVDTAAARGPLDVVWFATFDHRGALARVGAKGIDTAWFVEGHSGAEPAPLPAGVIPAWAPDGRTVAWFQFGTGDLVIGMLDSARRYALGGRISGIAWTAPGDAVLAMTYQPDGSSTLLRVGQEDSVEVLARGLDAPPRFAVIGVAPNDHTFYLALASDTLPDNAARHRPDAARDTDIYAFDLATRRVRLVVDGLGDDFAPQVAGNFLYWTHNELRDDIVLIPVSGGDAQIVVENAEIPYWSPDGSRLAFTFGGWRIADWALNLDAAVVGIDSTGKRVSEPTPVVTGYHEDFTPAWSPDGRWMVYHSHRSGGPVPDYSAPGSTDDLYLRRDGAPMAEEIRLTDFGWEVGVADWAPDGRRLVFDSWARDGPPAQARPWIATIDPTSGRRHHFERLPIPPEVRGTLFLSWSPRADRDEIAFIAAGEGARQSLWITTPSGRGARKLLDFESATYGGLDWSPDGERIVFSGLAGGRMQLFEIARGGGAPRQLTRDPHGILHPQVSPDGRWIAASRIRRSMELRRIAVGSY